MATLAFSSQWAVAQTYNTEMVLHDSLMAPQEIVQTITEKELYKHLSFIASDELRGRDTGSPELDIAARYLASHLESYGYTGLGENGSFFQPVPLHKVAFDNSSLQLSFKGKTLSFKNGEDVAVYGAGMKDIDFTLPMVSVGTGLFLENEKTYEPSQVEGKIAVRFALPDSLKAKGTQDFNYLHVGIRNKLYENGAKAVIYVMDDEDEANMNIRRYFGITEGFNMGLSASEETRLYVLMKRSVFDQILKLERNKKFDASKVYDFKNEMTLKLGSKYELIYSKNVVAKLEGTDPELKKEFVGFGAHYDHVGANDSLIYNGADDDGSGTVGVLNIAKAIAQSPPKRSTFIIFHTGEEKGLFGSEYYSEHPLIPIEQMVAVVNMDMIGSDYQNEKVHVVGADRIAEELHDINEMVNAKSENMELDYTYNADDHPERIYYRSDHYNYARKGIPVIFYTNDNPLHYHKPTDTVDTINFAKMVRIARLGLQTGYYVANKGERLVITTPLEKEAE